MQIVASNNDDLLTHIACNWQTKSAADHITQEIQENVIKTPIMKAEFLEGLKTMNNSASTAAAANFTAAGRGAIINIASVVALAPEMFNAVYSATKAYVLSLTQTLNGEVKAQGLQVQAVLPGITRTEIWERSGMDDSALPASMIMEVGEMVDAALAGFDQGELITIPSLPDAADWQAFTDARGKLAPNLSHSSAAARYK